MELDQAIDVDVGDAVAVRAQEGVAVDVSFDALDPASGHRVGAGVGQRHAIVLLAVLIVIGDLMRPPQRDGEIALHRFVVEEVVLDHVASIAEAKHEILEIVMRVQLHDVPQERVAPHLDQGLWLELGFLSQPGAQPAAENDYLQVRSGAWSSGTRNSLGTGTALRAMRIGYRPHDVFGPSLDLFEDLGDVFGDDAETQELHRTEEQHGDEQRLEALRYARPKEVQHRVHEDGNPGQHHHHPRQKRDELQRRI